MWPHLCHFSGHQPDIQLPEPAFHWLWLFFLDIGTCFSQQYTRPEQPGNHGPTPGTAFNQWTSLSCGIYLRNAATVPEGLELVTCGGALLLMYLYCPSPLPCITASSLHPQFALKIFSQGLHLKKPKLKQNKTISHLSGGSSASLNKVSQPCVYFPGRAYVNKAAVIDGENKSYGNTPPFCALLPPTFRTPGLFNQGILGHNDIEHHMQKIKMKKHPDTMTMHIPLLWL